ncbi:MAG: gephyrin-like molybdotransferase Glp [Pseudomonadota bacterium]
MMDSCDTTPLLGYDDALMQLTKRIKPDMKTTDKPVMEALGGVLAQNIKATIDVPNSAMSSMDGYAIRCCDLSQGQTTLPVSQRIAAGEAGQALVARTAARIFTGAPIPEGADAVIMQEQVDRLNDQIHFDVHPAPGQNIRPRGNDIKAGDQILTAGSRLRAQDLGQAASVGLQTLPVFNRVRVGMFFTGDELIEPGQPLARGKIYDSNRYTLRGLLETMGCEIVDLGLVGDTLDETRKAMQDASGRADLVVTTGGVSVGEEDHVRIALEQCGELMLWRLAIKPGKPLAYGEINNTSFIGLPGNPVSVFATFCLFVCPVIKIMQGREWRKPIAFPVRSNFDWLKPDSRREFLRARLNVHQGETVVEIYPNQDSGVLTSTVWADGFVEIAENQTVRNGEMVSYIPFTQFFS